MLPDLDLAETFRRVPAEGIDLWSLQVAWADPVPITLPVNAGEDLSLLASREITSVRGLLAARPSSLLRDPGMNWESLATYRLVARWALAGQRLGPATIWPA